MKISEIRDMTVEEMSNSRTELKDQLFKLRFQHAMGQLENTMKLKSIKRNLARIETISREKSKGTE